MKRFFILFCYMLLAFSTPVRAAINSTANCKTRIEDKYNALYDFDKDAEYQTFYDSKYTQAKQKFARQTGIPTSKAGLERKLGKALLKVLFGK